MKNLYNLLNDWLTDAQQARPQPDETLRPGLFRLAVLGIGQELCGDDAAGVLTARSLASRLPESAANVLILETGPAPENFTGPLRRFSPDLVLLLDAAEMGEPPGTLRILPARQALGFGGSTHTLPLHMLAEFITAELGCPVDLIGIQPRQNAPHTPLSPEVEETVQQLAEALAKWITKPLDG